ncbi:putative reverse transcriptase domain-containing protein [Tanacetum coccineum]
MDNSKRRSIPMQEKPTLSKSQGASTSKEVRRMQRVPYASSIGSIMYAVRCTRNTKDMFLIYGGNMEWELRVTCYIGVRYQTDVDDSKSHNGYIFVSNGGVAGWKSAKESTTTTSSTKVEYMDALEAAKEDVWIRKFISRLVIELGDIKLVKVHTDENVVDPFTKALHFNKHSSHTKSIGLILVSIPRTPRVPQMKWVHLTLSQVMAAPVISILSDSSEESVGVLDLVDYSFSSDSDPSKDSLPIAPELPLVSPFLCSDDSEADSESESAEQRPESKVSYNHHIEFPSTCTCCCPPRIRKRVGPFPACRLAWRRVSHRSSDRHYSLDFTSNSSSSSSSLDSSSDISSVASPRLVDPLVRTTRCSEAFMRWWSAPLSTLYPPMTSKSSLGSSSERSLDSSSPSAGPSRKRCRSPATLVPLSTSVLRLIAPALADLPPHKREEEEEFEEEACAGGMMEIAVDPLVTSGISKPTRGDDSDLEGAMSENMRFEALLCIERDRVNSLRRHMALSSEEFHQVRKDRDDTRRRLRRTMTNTRSKMTPAAIKEIINQRVTEALETREANRNIGLGNGNDEGGNENGNGTEGVVGLIRWVEKMETIFHISNCPEKYQVKYATCTLLNSALTWWNSHKRTIGTDAAFSMSWRELMKLMAEVYYPRTEIQKMKSELCNLTVKNNNLAAYTQRFQELTMLCTKMVPEEEDQVDMFIRGLPDNIQGNVIFVEPTRLQDAVRMANNLMDQKLKGYAMKNAENKRKFDNSQKDNRGQQLPNKRQNVGGQNVARAYTTGNNERRVYNGPLPLATSVNFIMKGHALQGHYKSDCPKLKDQNRGNKSDIGEARGKAYVLGGGDANPDSNVVTELTLAEYMILSGTDNRPPMLDKDLYDSWKIRMELYMQNREHGRMILESVENGPLIWPTVEENGVIRTKKYAELSATEKIQADCDMKATNIILQGLPTEIYSLVNHHRVTKDLWERVQLLMQGTSLTKQERECKLYDTFDKFTHIKGNTSQVLLEIHSADK